MKRTLYVSLLAIGCFSACQGSEESEQSQEKEYTVSIMARIGKTIPGARYLQENENTAAGFTTGDDIGVFMDDDNAVRWIFDGTSWTTGKSVFWKDKDEEHTFCAYYPHSGSEAENKGNITMPSLDSQDGTWENLGRYDFLTASRTLSYHDGLGNVAFTGDYSFKHILSLLKINIKGEGDMAQAVIDKIILEGNELMTQGYYSFETNSITIGETPKETLRIAPAHTMNNQEASFYFILNGSEKDGDMDSRVAESRSINLTIEYTRNNQSYTARREGLSPGLLSGCIHKYSIVVKDGNLIITGGSISDWTPGNEEEDIIINGEEIG